MKLEAKIEFESNLLDGTGTYWTAQLYRSDDDSKTVFVRIVDRSGNNVFEIMLDELENLCEALRIANCAELEVEDNSAKEE